jgi:hypothetical protein
VHAALVGLRHGRAAAAAAAGVLLRRHGGEPKDLVSVTGARLAYRVEPTLAVMNSSGNSANPSRREHAPLPDCLTRLLDPQRLSGGYITRPAGPVLAGSDKRTYVRVLASIWLDLDRLGRLTDSMVNR